MLRARVATDPPSLTYKTMRKLVGFVALGLPFAVSIPVYIYCGGFQSSISGYYYTGTRNVFVGSLFAIASFMACTRGYDVWDELAGYAAAAFAFVVALFPTSPDAGATCREQHIAVIHGAAASLLFLTLAVFCLVLFRMSAENVTVTPRKLDRNRVYTICGCIILACMATALGLELRRHFQPAGAAPAKIFVPETLALIAFGVAWLIKGELLLKDT